MLGHHNDVYVNYLLCILLHGQKLIFLHFSCHIKHFFGPVLSFCQLGYSSERQHFEVLDVLVLLT